MLNRDFVNFAQLLEVFYIVGYNIKYTTDDIVSIPFTENTAKKYLSLNAVSFESSVMTYQKTTEFNVGTLL